MKGAFITDLWWAIIFIIIVSFLATAFLLFGAIHSISNTGANSQSVNFVNEANRPYLVAELLSHYRAGDRQFLEHSLETIVTGSPRNTNSLYTKDFVDKFLEFYDMNFYSISIKDENDNDLLVISNIDIRCGQNNKGICVRRSVFQCKNVIPVYANCKPVAPKYGECGNGRLKIDDISNDCDSQSVCCMENKDSTGHNLDTEGNVIPNCGPVGNKLGVCDDDRLVDIYSIPFVYEEYKHTWCREGRTMIEKEAGECDGEKNICCVSRTDTAEFSILTEAKIPILYKKGVLGYVEVMTGA